MIKHDQVEIRHGVPLPPKGSSNALAKARLGRPPVITAFHRLDVGDSFTVECPDMRKVASWESSFRSSANNWGRKLGRKFAVRNLTNGDKRRKLGVWRVE